ncbi:di-heme-cytochrome C peroxidase [Bradyrhizobium prioriisuperbiae]|uniref:di-heme-cytochrome C peroxidase n=1 Tax=Bradyrhizobium prioriisuperbiae TaxID=2854389 RepID=UPI0028E5BD27|nr:di-heme-cytochrome C peroxidase [Bradyrhizobium prioritasuperba]
MIRLCTLAVFLLAFFGLPTSSRAAQSCGNELGQGWTQCDRDWWYTVTQGSRLLPLAWMKVLEEPDGPGKILSDTNITRFNYLLNPKSKRNPEGLPVGFAVDNGGSGSPQAMCRTFGKLCESGTMTKPWVGFNCSACHTNDIAYKGKTIRIDGAPTLADFQGFTNQILASLIATSSNDDKFRRFALAVLGSSATEVERQHLNEELQQVVSWEKTLHNQNGDSIQYGFGRLDAQGHILNKVSLILDVTSQLHYPADAPASYPHIWNAPQHDLVQWNGLAPNKFEYQLGPGLKTNIGSLARNTGEVIGVFAHVDASNADWLGGYKSSIQLANLIDIERHLGKLQSPRWPEDILGKIDVALAKQGEIKFKAICAECHAPLARTDLKSVVKAEMRPLTSVGTDLALACNTFAHTSKTGETEGRKVLVVLGDTIKATEPTATLLRHMIAGSIVGERSELAKKAIKDLFTPSAPPTPLEATISAAAPVEYLPGVSDPATKKRAENCLRATGPDFKGKSLAYKARPLNGIWATAPYLHNGSVPTLYDLLLPTDLRNTAPLANAVIADSNGESTNGVNKRPISFYVGSREFDPKNVGFVTAKSEISFEFRVRDQSNTPIFGNYNSGHEYGTLLNDEDRRALVEYLKTL